MQLDLIETYYNIKPGKSKTCKICNKKKHIDSFGSMRTNKDRIDTRCKQCVSEETKIRNNLRKEYAAENESICHCCGGTHHKSLVVDHCHDTGNYRGWLCEPCNFAIGHLGDNIEGVKKAVKYLEKYHERT